VIYYAAPSLARPSGGVRTMYRHVDALNAAGLPAAVVHERRGFRCTWFDNRTRVEYPPLVLNDDVLVLPEQFSAESLARIAPGVPKVVLNQGVYRTFAAKGPRGPSPSVDGSDVVAAVVVSQDSERYLHYAFPDLPVHLVRHCIDGRVFFPDFTAQDRRIAVMPYKRPQEFAQVCELLRRRRVLDDWEVVILHGLPEAAVAHELRRAPLFLNLPGAEGFGLPAAEAVASGCFVIGFHGLGGREYLRPPHATIVDDGDVVGVATAVEEFTRRFDTCRDSLALHMSDAADQIRATYSHEHQTADLVDAFGGLPHHGRSAGTVLNARELHIEPGWRRTTRRVAVRVGRGVRR
jgi:hypothetical protein